MLSILSISFFLAINSGSAKSIKLILTKFLSSMKIKCGFKSYSIFLFIKEFNSITNLIKMVQASSSFFDINSFNLCILELSVTFIRIKRTILSSSLSSK